MRWGFDREVSQRMPDAADMRSLEAVLRSLATAARSLRLYPATSPIPLQSVQAVRRRARRRTSRPAPTRCRIALARDGLLGRRHAARRADSRRPRPLRRAARPRRRRDRDDRREVTGEELLAFLSIVARPVDEVRAEGGVGALAQRRRRRRICTSPRSSSRSIEQELDPESRDVASTSSALAEDPGELAAWYAAAAAGDPERLRGRA